MKRRLVMAVLLSALAAGACGAAEEPARGSIRDREEKEEETKEPETTSVPVQSTEPTEAPTETPVETPVEEEEVHALQVDIENLYDGWSNDDYTVYASLLTPEITLKSEGYDKLAAALNSYGKELQDRGSKEDLPGMINMAKEYEPYADPDGTVGFVTEYNTTAVRADSVAVSLLTSNYIDAHGAHPGYVYMTRNFDSKTGAELSVYDVINADQIDRLPDIIADVLLQYYDPMIFNSVDDLPGTISDMLGMNGDLVYTLGYDGISFYFSPYDLASYAAGEQIATILYDDMPELVKPEYREAPENYIRALSSYGKNLLPDGRILELSIYPYGEEYEEGVEVDTVLESNSSVCEIADAFDAEPYLVHADGKNYLYVEWSTFNDYSLISVFDLNGSSVGSPREFDRGFRGGNDPDAMKLYGRGDLLSTVPMYRFYHVGADGMPESNTEFDYIDADPQYYTLTLKQDYTGEIRKDFDTPENYTYEDLPKGTKLYFYATDNETWVDFTLKDGRFVRIYVDMKDYQRTVDGIAIEDLFDGIIFAG